MTIHKTRLSSASHTAATAHLSCVVAALCGFALSACSSTPMHYYTLQTPPPLAQAHHSPAAFSLNVLPVGVPPQLDNANLVIRDGQSETKVFDTLRWTASFSDEIRGALSTTLTDRLQSQDVAGLQAPAGKPVMTVSVQIRRFDATPGQAVYADIDWSLRLQKDGAASGLVCHAVLQQTAPGDYTALVGAEQHVIQTLSAQIATTANRWFAAPSSGCTI